MAIDVRPLTGLRVLAIEQLMALPFGTQLLADFGADVLAVESIGYPENQAISWRLRTGRHKRRVQIKLNDARGQQLVRRLAGTVDVVAENFRPGVMDRYGLGYRDLKELDERLIYVSVSGYGHPDFLPSPLTDMAAYGPIGEAMSGSLHSLRRHGGTSSGLALGDITSAMFATVGLLLALRHRELTGKGQYVDISMADSLLALAELPLISHTMSADGGSSAPTPAGRNPLSEYPSGTFSASDGEFQLIMMNDAHWMALCHLLGKADWLTAERFEDPQRRATAIRDEAVPALQEWSRQRTKLEAAQRCRDAGLAAAPINGPADVLDDPHFAARKMIATVERPDGSSLRVTGDPIKMSAVDPDGDGRPRIARSGEHTRQVLLDELGIEPTEYQDLLAAGVIAES